MTAPTMPKKLPTRLQSDFKGIETITKVADAVPVESAIATHAISNESMVDVLLMLEPRIDMYDVRSESDRRLIRVKLHSKVKPALFSYSDIVVKGKSVYEMAHAVEFLGGALAERQAIMYGDKHDPSECAKLARRHYAELCDYLDGSQAG